MINSGMIRDETQEGKILRLLESHGSAWTPAPELAMISLQYCRSVNALRRHGFEIENRVENHDGVRHGFYGLTQKPVQTARTRTSMQTVPPAAESASLFGDLPRERHRDDG